jgi:hypothetical protein
MRGILIGAAGAALLTASAVAMAVPVRVIQETSLRNLALPAPTRLSPIPDAKGREGSFAKNDVLFSFRIDQPPVARIAKAVAVEAAGKNFAFEPGEEFVLSITDSRMRGRIPEGSTIFCGEAKENATAKWLSSLLTKFGAETRPCFIDSDGDGRFDKFFLSGTKRDEDSGLVPVEPAAFTTHERNGGPGDHADFVFRGFTKPGFTPKVSVRRYVDGKEKDFMSLFLGNDLRSFHQYSDFMTPAADGEKRGVLPYDARFIAGAAVSVATVDPEKHFFSGKVTPPRRSMWVYFFTGREKYVPVTH